MELLYPVYSRRSVTRIFSLICLAFFTHPARHKTRLRTIIFDVVNHIFTLLSAWSLLSRRSFSQAYASRTERGFGLRFNVPTSDHCIGGSVLELEECLTENGNGSASCVIRWSRQGIKMARRYSDPSTILQEYWSCGSVSQFCEEQRCRFGVPRRNFPFSRKDWRSNPLHRLLHS